VELVPVELVGDLLFLGGALQRLPVVTECFRSRSWLCHNGRIQQVEDHTGNSV